MLRLLVALFLIHREFALGSECQISIKPNHFQIPLLLNENDVLYEPNADGNLIFTDKNRIFIYCPGQKIQINGKSTQMTSTSITCINGAKFNVEGVSGDVAFDGIQCSGYPYHEARYTGNSCLNNYKEIEVGFDLSDRFIRNYLVCFDDKNQNSLYSTFTMSSKISGEQVSVPRPDFIQGSFYNVKNTNVNNLYKRETQRKTINNLLGMSTNNYTYISKSDDFFLSRGHYTANADFVYGFAQRSTFYYVNVAPQWQTFNGGNWNDLEQSIRYFVGHGSSDIIVYTGSYGISTLPHATTGKDTKLFLYINSELNGIAVPDIYWKVIYDPEKQLGTAFVGVNNPYNDKHQKLCKDVSSQLTWLRWDPDNVTFGISYACTVDDLRKAIPTIPSFNVNDLLK